MRLEIGDLSVLIEPKIGIPQLLSLACYAMGVVKHQDLRMFDFKKTEALPDMLACALSAAARRAFRRGLLHGYRTEEEALYGIRGRIRFDDQLRRRFAIAMPVEVRYDEFTNDILANRLVKAAAERLGKMRLRSQEARSGLGWIAGMLNHVSPVDFPARQRAIGHIRPAERTLPGRGGTVTAHPAAQRVRVQPGCGARFWIPCRHECPVRKVHNASAPRSDEGLRSHLPESSP